MIAHNQNQSQQRLNPQMGAKDQPPHTPDREVPISHTHQSPRQVNNGTNDDKDRNRSPVMTSATMHSLDKREKSRK